MGQTDSNTNKNIETLTVSPKDIQLFSPAQKYFFQYPKIGISMADQNEETISNSKGYQYRQRSVKVSIFEQHITLSLKIHTYMSKSLELCYGSLKIFDSIPDEIYQDRVIYQVEKGHEKYSMQVIQYEGKKGTTQMIQQIITSTRIDSLNCPNIMFADEYFCIQKDQSNDEKMGKALVLLMEPISLSLSEIIEMRRQKKMQWSLSQFYALLRDVVTGLQYLHNSEFSHNDIRPSSIYYSQDKKKYLLGNLGRLTKFDYGEDLPRFLHTCYYKDSSIAHKLHSKNSQDSVDLRKCDVYSLGMTLLSAFYLCQPVDRKKCSPINRSLIKQYPFLQIIMLMVKEKSQRIDIFQVALKLQDYESGFEEGGELSQSRTLVGHDQQDDEKLDYNKVMSIKKANSSLGMLKEWRSNLTHCYSLLPNKSDIDKISYLKEMGEIQKLAGGSLEKSKNFYRKAAQIYYDIGHSCLKEEQFTRAEVYFQDGIECYEQFMGGNHSPASSSSLHSIASIKGFSLPQTTATITTGSISHQTTIPARSEVIFLKCFLGLVLVKIRRGEDELYELVLDSVREQLKTIGGSLGPIDKILINQYLGEIYGYLKSHKVSAKFYLENSQIIQKMSLKNKMHIQNYIKLAQCYIEDSKLTTIERIRADDLQKCELYLNLAKTNCELEHFGEASESFHISRLSGEMVFLRGKVEESKMMLEEVLEKCENYLEKCNVPEERYQVTHILADSHSFLATLQESRNRHLRSLGHQEQALKHYQRVHGGIYNHDCAITIQKMGKLNHSIEHFEDATSCLQLSEKILLNQFNPSQHDLERVQFNIKRNSIDYFEESTSLKRSETTKY